jgi:hypothetical protein
VQCGEGWGTPAIATTARELATAIEALTGAQIDAITLANREQMERFGYLPLTLTSASSSA